MDLQAANTIQSQLALQAPKPVVRSESAVGQLVASIGGPLQQQRAATKPDTSKPVPTTAGGDSTAKNKARHSRGHHLDHSA